MQWLFKTDYRSFYLLNTTQFLGALNDNIFKLLVIYLFIHIQGAAAAPAILSLAGAIFVIPFLLFSSGAGVLADKISKRTIIVITKGLELVIMLFAVLAVYLQSEFGAFTCLFFMAAQSALFGPSKYGIIPELIEEKKVSKANGSITSFTYLAIILGTFLASFITDVTNKNFVLESCFCVFIAVIGLLTSLGIRRTEPKRSTKKINPFFLYEIYQTLKVSWKLPHLITAMFSSAFFLFIGSFTQLNIIPFAIQSLGLSEVGGGYLFLATAVGIAIGAVIAGQLSKDKVEPGLSCICGFFISLFFFTLSLFSFSLTCTIISLALLGVVGGGFLIPFDSFVQINSPDEKRGQVIAAANFFSFVGVLLAAFFLYLMSAKLGLSAAGGFATMGFFSLIGSILITGRLSSFFLSFLVQKVLKKFWKVQLTSPLPNPGELIVLQSTSFWDAILLLAAIPKLKIVLPDPYLRSFPWFNGLIDSFTIVPPDLEMEEMEQRFQKQPQLFCLFLHKKKDVGEILAPYKKIFDNKLLFVRGKREKTPRYLFLFHIYTRLVSLTFSKSPSE
jgi:acyl-[acyl-carrier-protein]-phospholipid O-acyltransferase/long-chain-fatty-acid--[acyl-carrier-protein] ligase